MRKQIIIPKINVSLHQHDMDNFLRCPQKYYLGNVMGIVPIGISRALNIGDLFAKCVYFLHKGEGVATCMAYVYQLQNPLIKRATRQETIDQLETDVTIVQSMLFGYETRFLMSKSLHVATFNERGGLAGFDDIEIKKITPERKIEVQFEVGNYVYNYINRLDGEVETNGNPWILEIKTTSQVDTDMIKKLNLNFQINSYWLAEVMKYNRQVDGVLYRYIKKPSIRQKQGETVDAFRRRLSKDYTERPEFYFVEESLKFTQYSLEVFKRDLRTFFEELTRCYVTGRWVCKGTACDSNFGLCQYLRYCSNPTEETLRTYYEQKRETD